MKLVVATLTPFTEDGAVDLDTVRRHARWLRDNGADLIAPTGTTGEFLYLSTEERRAVHRAVLASVDGVIPCVWDSLPGRPEELARAAEAEGACGVFLSPPLYQRVSDSDILAWYQRVRDAVSIEVFAYHHPSTHNALSVELVERLFREVGVDAMKDSSGDVDRLRALAAAWPGKVWVGGDQLLGQMGSLGPVAGHISGLANLYPALARDVLDGADDAGWMAVRTRLRAYGSSVPTMKRAMGFGLRPPVVGPAVSLDVPSPGF